MSWDWLRDPFTRRRRVIVIARLRDDKGRIKGIARTEFTVIHRRRW